MATHKLDDNLYLDLEFNPDLWKGINTGSLSELISDLFPPIKKLTSLSENRTFSWCYGRVGMEGDGYVEVTYPYEETHYYPFTLKNVDFSTLSFIHLRAVPREKSTFKCWKDSVTGKVLGTRPDFLVSEHLHRDITGFIAVFEDASSLGI